MAELIAVPGVMARLGIGRTKLYELIDSGELRGLRIGSRRFVTDAALDRAFITRLQRTSAAPYRIEIPGRTPRTMPRQQLPTDQEDHPQ